MNKNESNGNYVLLIRQPLTQFTGKGEGIVCPEITNGDVPLSRETSATPILCFTCHRKLPVLNGRKVGMTSNQHGSYTLGDTRATMGSTKGRQAVRWSKS